jgi:predicted lactoylglutathione lyase
MPGSIFISLPVADVTRSTAFYQAIGFEKDPRMSGEHASSMRWSDTVAINVLDQALYNTLTPKQIIDAHTTSGVLIALSFNSKAEVDAITSAAVAAGGQEAHDAEDNGFMYSRAFTDPDGHGFGPFWMDMEAAAAAMARGDAT